jgi:Glycosyl hydrolase family 3 C-terminal domain/Fibronectin type III-like domain/Glycosyl hydrolase family 3 N terminal domain
VIQSADIPFALHESELAARVASLSLDQKVRLLAGAYFWSLHPEPAVGLRRLLASEARRKGVDVVLAPTVNLHRTPYSGRHSERFSEDPLLIARIGVSYVRGLGGGSATVFPPYTVSLPGRQDELVRRIAAVNPNAVVVVNAGAPVLMPWVDDAAAVLPAWFGGQELGNARRPHSAIDRPVRWLVGFAAVLADLGESAATIIVPPRAFEHWSAAHGDWIVEPGTFELAAGASSAELPLCTGITVA